MSVLLRAVDKCTSQMVIIAEIVTNWSCLNSVKSLAKDPFDDQRPLLLTCKDSLKTVESGPSYCTSALISKLSQVSQRKGPAGLTIRECLIRKTQSKGAKARVGPSLPQTSCIVKRRWKMDN